MKNYLLFLFFLISNDIYAQHNVTLNICGNDEKIVFKNDSVKNLASIGLVGYRFLPSVKKSDALVEIRIYNESGNWGNINIYKFYEDSIRIVNYKLLSIANNGKDEHIGIPNYYFAGSNVKKKVFLRKVADSSYSGKKTSCEFLSEILNSGIGKIANGPLIDDLIRLNFPSLNKYDEGLSFTEINVAGHYRNFLSPRILYHLTPELSKGIPDLQDRTLFFNLLKEINN